MCLPLCTHLLLHSKRMMNHNALCFSNSCFSPVYFNNVCVLTSYPAKHFCELCTGDKLQQVCKYTFYKKYFIKMFSSSNETFSTSTLSVLKLPKGFISENRYSSLCNTKKDRHYTNITLKYVDFHMKYMQIKNKR